MPSQGKAVFATTMFPGEGIRIGLGVMCGLLFILPHP